MAQPQCTTLASYASGTNAAGATLNGTSEDCRQAVMVTFSGTITNGATGPTIPAQANLQVSEDNSTWYTVASATGSTSNFVAGPPVIGLLQFDFRRLYPGSWCRVQITGNTGQSVTYAVVGNIITAIS